MIGDGLQKLIATEDVAGIDLFLYILSIDKSQMTIDNYLISRQAATITLTITLTKLIATEDVAGVDFFLNVIQNHIITIGDDGL